MLATAEIAGDIWVLPLLAILIVALAFFGAGVRDWMKRRATRLQRLEGGRHMRVEVDPDGQCEQPSDARGVGR